MKTTTKFLAAVAVFATVGCLALFYWYLHYVYYTDDWKQRTTPLPSETIAQLCASFGLEKDSDLCNGREIVYGPDFTGVIRDTFRPYEAYEIPSSEAATYDEVEEKLGEFKYECEPVVETGDGFTYFVCSYDLRGDREFPIGIIFTYPEKAVFRIMINMGYGGE